MASLEFPHLLCQPFIAMLDEGKLAEPQFSLWLNPDLQSQEAGELVFGGYDSGHMAGDLIELPVVAGATHWTVLLDAVTIGEETVKGVTATLASLDSGTNTIRVPDADYKTINEAALGLRYMEKYDAYTIPCKQANNETVPALGFTLNGTSFTIAHTAWLFVFGDVHVSDDDNFDDAEFVDIESSGDSSSRLCYSAIRAGGPPDATVLGSNFLREWFSLYTYDPPHNTIALAPAASAAADVEPDQSLMRYEYRARQ
ncbi:hypothetical protein WJX73_008401 [Symbiochloris irregularis]|uniref:Peptidase A1 domain-containing protein n=1 Tax=Symbiochloris irregularis TaxID=706552 RepID=A0AAW1PW02_9CHLO